ncbi:ABC transporter ATP-binding protein [Microbacterium xanthum]|uniref:ABC transporter ATP-binding protein n=1 Tax=Microbacterium xanthum TaxID=3079794 RepID=UPI002AD3DE1E|nr:ABC transporter ATP-binding protein [Microbacterium sp. KSW-48]MDZ8171179.1 ABC transporter ATP-binding protein [Microbacterium sp. KSW-48]
MSTLLSVRDLATTFHTSSGPVTSVRGVSFDLRRGESLALVGESGSGKSVTAMSIMNMVRSPGVIEAGQVMLDGRDVLAMGADELRGVRGRRMSMIFQDSVAALDPLMKIEDQVVESIRAHRRVSDTVAHDEAVHLLEMVGIPDPAARLKDYPLAFSGGMAQRVMIAIALANQPELLICDEPTTALDVTVQAQILELIAKLNREQNTSVLFITHNLGVVAQLCQRVAVMYAGRIVEIGDTASVFADPRHPYTRDLLKATPTLTHPRHLPLTSIEGRPPSLREEITGCAYAPRDPLAFEKCFASDPALTAGGEGRSHACWLGDAPLPASRVEEGSAESAISSTEKEVVLEVRDLVKHFPGPRKGFFSRREVRAVDGVDFEIRASETVGLVGESGCGKSTIARLVLGIDEPSSGAIVYDGKDATGLNAAARRRYNRDVQIVFQNPMSALNPRMVVRKMLGLTLRGQGVKETDIDTRSRELLELVGLDASALDRYPHEFSGGQKQRLVIARALAMEPKLIVCDEAVAALDVSLQAQILNLLKELKERLGLSYLFIGHDLATVRYVADRILVMYLGQIVESGPSEDVIARPLHPYTASLLSAVPDPDPSQAKGERVVLQGEVPTPLDPPSGCRFHTRCPIGPMVNTDREICRTERPMVDDADLHGVACHFAGEFRPGAPAAPERPEGLGPVRSTGRVAPAGHAA